MLTSNMNFDEIINKREKEMTNTGKLVPSKKMPEKGTKLFSLATLITLLIAAPDYYQEDERNG